AGVPADGYDATVGHRRFAQRLPPGGQDPARTGSPGCGGPQWPGSRRGKGLERAAMDEHPQPGQAFMSALVTEHFVLSMGDREGD
ncbi:MAG TPA: hypothetical protein VJ140_03910, partial [Actinomycetota bacterium]|nr:hypothetical protein [Actinomycetota bacterium]